MSAEGRGPGPTADPSPNLRALSDAELGDIIREAIFDHSDMYGCHWLLVARALRDDLAALVPAASAPAGQGAALAVHIDDRDVEDIERMASAGSVLHWHWSVILRIIARMREAEAALTASAASPPSDEAECAYLECGCCDDASCGSALRLVEVRSLGYREGYAAATASPNEAPAGWRPPKGYVLVPREPTDRMHKAARDWSYRAYGKPIGLDASNGCWRAMIAAAPPAAREGE